MPADQRATVVVVTCDRRDELSHTLHKLAGLPERPPVIVVDNGSCDGTAAMVRRDHPASCCWPPGATWAPSPATWPCAG